MADPLSGIQPTRRIDLRVPDTNGISIRANPGPEVTDFRPEHDPPHVHLGSNDGPRVDTQNFKPLSKKDAMRMNKEQFKMCSNLSDETKALIRRRQTQVFKFGKVLIGILGSNRSIL